MSTFKASLVGEGLFSMYMQGPAFYPQYLNTETVYTVSDHENTF